MIGFFDYTVWLTYFSFISAGTGIYLTLACERPDLGIICVLISGLFDAFDGKVASTKKDRTELGKKFGIQIDSLSDLTAFGVLPGIIGIEEFRLYFNVHDGCAFDKAGLLSIIAFIVMIIYMLSGYIRLAYFNVTEEERQKSEPGSRVYYQGLPITSSALVFPLLYVLKSLSVRLYLIVYFVALLILAFLFILNIKVKKPGLKGIIIMAIIGAADLILLLFI